MQRSSAVLLDPDGAWLLTLSDRAALAVLDSTIEAAGLGWVRRPPDCELGHYWLATIEHLRRCDPAVPTVGDVAQELVAMLLQDRSVRLPWDSLTDGSTPRVIALRTPT